MNDEQLQVVLSAVDKNFTSAMQQAIDALGDVSKANDNLSSKSSSTSSSVTGGTQRMISGFTQMASAMGAVAIAAKAFDVVKSTISGAISRVDTLNNATRTFQNMGFNNAQIQSSMDGLKKSIQALPTPLDEAVKGVQMLAASTNDLGTSQKVYSALNDAILGFGGNTQDVSNAIIQLSQAFANGKVDGMTWISMMNSNMGPVLTAIARQMGITTAQLKDGLSSGKISVADFENALIGLDQHGGGGLKSLQKIAEDSTSGIQTSMANAKNSMQRGMGEVIKSINKSLTANGLPTIAQVITDAGNSINGAFEKIAKGAPKVISAIAPMIKYLKPIAPLLKGIAIAFVGMGVIAMLAPVLAPVVTVFGALFGILKKVFGIAGSAGKGIFNLGKSLFGIGGHGKSAKEGLDETASGAENAGKSSSMSAGQILAMGAAIMMAAIGAAVLVGSFALLVQQVTNLAKVGPMGAVAFLAVAAGMAAVIAVMGIVGKMLGAMGVQAAIAYAGMALLVGAFALLTMAVTQLAKTGSQGVIALTVLTIAIVAITAVMGIFAPIFQACIPGLIAFGAAILMVGAGVAIAAAGLALLVLAFTGLVTAITALASQGPIAIGVILALTVGIVAMTAVLAIFGPLLTASAVGLLAFGAAVLMAGVGIGVAAAGIAVLVDALSNLLSTNTVLGQIISDVWNGIKSVISGVAQAVGPIVSAGFNTMKSVATGIMNALKAVISGVWNGIKGVFNAGVKFIQSVMHVDLSGNGESIMNSLWNGMKRVWEGIKSWVSGLADWIKAHKGPISYDRRLLTPAGQAIMHGLNRGLVNGFDNVQSTILDITDSIANTNIALPSVDTSRFNDSINSISNRMSDMGMNVNGSLSSTATIDSASSRAFQARMEMMMQQTIDKLDNVDQHPVVTVDTMNTMRQYNSKADAQAYVMLKGGR